MALSAHADDTNSQSYELDIDALPLTAAVKALSDETGIEVLYFSEVAEGITSTPVRGAYTPQEALETMLVSTDLEVVSLDGEGAVAIRPVNSERGNSDSKNLTAKPLLMAQNQTATPTGTQDSRTSSRNSDSEGLETMPLEEIIVTGSNIRGAQRVSPVVSIDRDGIDRTGFATVQQLIQSLPQNFGGDISDDTAQINGRGSNIANFGFGSGVNLRGLGTDSTLVLLNGRRLAAGGFGSFVDISFIPINAIDRVEVLMDGASAIYGSDAVGGVVNFILRKDYDGAETRARYGSITEGDLDELQFGQTFGKTWDAGRALITYEYYSRDNLDSADRDFSEPLPDPIDLFPEQERHSMFFSGAQELNDKVELFGTAFYAKRDVEYNAIIRGSTDINRSISDVDQLGLTLGGSLDIADMWKAELVATYGSSDTKSSASISSGEGAPFIPDPSSDGDLDSDFLAIDLLADGGLIDLPGGMVKLAIGGQFRNETLTTDSFFASVDLSRDIYAGFVEASIPLVGEGNTMRGIERFELTAAVRHEDYSDFGSTTNPKFGLLYTPFDGFDLRATYGASFRAPLLVELDTSQLSGILADLPNPASPTGTTLTLLAFGFGPENNLGPEEATTWTAGFDISPEIVPGLSLGATYFNIEFDGRIDQTLAFFDAFTDPQYESILFSPPPDDAVAALSALSFPQFFNLTTSLPADAEVFVDNRRKNTASTQTDGFDIILEYSRESDLGLLGIGLNVNYLLKFEEQLTPTAEVFDLAGTVYNPIDLRMRGALSWARDRFAATAFINYADGYSDDQVDPAGDLDSWTTIDLSLSYNFGERSDRNLVLSMQNLFDEDPPFVIDRSGINQANLGYDPENATPLGRFVSLHINMVWW